MKIKNHFETYAQLVTNKANCEAIFANSGMANDFMKLDFGFFPNRKSRIKGDSRTVLWERRAETPLRDSTDYDFNEA